jgi:hypothetical protein
MCPSFPLCIQAQTWPDPDLLSAEYMAQVSWERPFLKGYIIWLPQTAIQWACHLRFASYAFVHRFWRKAFQTSTPYSPCFEPDAAEAFSGSSSRERPLRSLGYWQGLGACSSFTRDTRFLFRPCCLQSWPAPHRTHELIQKLPRSNGVDGRQTLESGRTRCVEVSRNHALDVGLHVLKTSCILAQRILNPVIVQRQTGSGTEWSQTRASRLAREPKVFIFLIHVHILN